MDVDIILEIHRKLTPMVAIALAEQLVEFQPMFLEDAVQIDSIKSQAEIAQRTTLPVANGERMHSIWEFREMYEMGGSQYARPDLGLAGGFTAVKKIAAIAESWHSAVVTHNFLGPVLTAAACGLDTSIPNFVTQEYSKEDEAPFNALFNSAWKRDGGHITVPDVPGIGIDLDADELKAQAFEPRELQNIPMRTDGSVGYLFNKIGVLNYAPGTDEEAVMEAALEGGADDVVTADDGSIEVITSPENYIEVLESLEQAGLTPENSEITLRANLEVELDVETGQKLLNFLDVLEDLDDTQAVYSNADIPAESYG